MDSALVRNAQAARSKVQECDDAHNYLTAMTSGFYHTALDYVFQVCQQVSLPTPVRVFVNVINENLGSQVLRCWCPSLLGSQQAMLIIKPAGTNCYCLVNRGTCMNDSPKVDAWLWNGKGLNWPPIDC